MRNIVKISVIWTYENCNRFTFYVQLTTDEGFTITPHSFHTKSMYDEVGLDIEEARECALIEAANWGDLLEIEPEPFLTPDGQVIHPTMKFDTYTMRRKLKI